MTKNIKKNQIFWVFIVNSFSVSSVRVGFPTSLPLGTGTLSRDSRVGFRRRSHTPETRVRIPLPLPRDVNGWCARDMIDHLGPYNIHNSQHPMFEIARGFESRRLSNAICPEPGICPRWPQGRRFNSVPGVQHVFLQAGGGMMDHLQYQQRRLDPSMVDASYTATTYDGNWWHPTNRRIGSSRRSCLSHAGSNPARPTSRKSGESGGSPVSKRKQLQVPGEVLEARWSNIPGALPGIPR